jgi:hypothetical protein
MTLTADLSQFPREVVNRVVRKLRDEDAAEMDLAKARQAKIAQLYRNAVGPGTTKDGIGPISLAIDPYFVSYFRRLHGESVFQDDDFIRFLKKRGEWFHVPETGTRIQVGVEWNKRKERKVFA